MTDEYKDTIQAMMDSTWDSHLIGKGRDSGGMSHKNQKVIRVTRIENPALWKMYAVRRDMIKASEKPSRLLVATTRDDKSRRLGRELGLDASRDEVLLFTGTSHGQVTKPSPLYPAHKPPRPAKLPDIVSIIQQNGFDERVSSIKGMFGAAQ